MDRRFEPATTCSIRHSSLHKLFSATRVRSNATVLRGRSAEATWKEAITKGLPNVRWGPKDDSLPRLGNASVLQAWRRPHLRQRDRRTMTALECSQMGARLDDDHAPETNGRMSVCRRCGTHTDSPEGRHHTPQERQLARSSNWLIAEVHRRRIDRARGLRN